MTIFTRSVHLLLRVSAAVAAVGGLGLGLLQLSKSLPLLPYQESMLDGSSSVRETRPDVVLVLGYQANHYTAEPSSSAMCEPLNSSGRQSSGTGPCSLHCSLTTPHSAPGARSRRGVLLVNRSRENGHIWACVWGAQSAICQPLKLKWPPEFRDGSLLTPL